MKAITGVVAVGCVVGAVAYGISLMPREENGSRDAVTSYEVNRTVADFPVEENPSTPEAVYAAINRLNATGDQDSWRRLTVRRLTEGTPTNQGKREVSKAFRDELLNSKILEVRVFRGTHACVIAKVPHAWKSTFDYRSFELEDGRWRNSGNCSLGSLDAARKQFADLCDWTQRTSSAE